MPNTRAWLATDADRAPSSSSGSERASSLTGRCAATTLKHATSAHQHPSAQHRASLLSPLLRAPCAPWQACIMSPTASLVDGSAMRMTVRARPHIPTTLTARAPQHALRAPARRALRSSTANCRGTTGATSS
jgi:hypothetical protein